VPVWIMVLLGVGALSAAAAAVQALLELRDASRHPPPGQMVDVGGRRLHVLCKGDAPGPTVVIEQGLAGPSILWWPVQDAVAQFARVCTYDRAGFHWSDPAPGERNMLDAVHDLHAVLTRAKIPGPYVLVGHSYGGPLVRVFAREYPNEVAGLVLVDTPDESIVFRKSFDDYNRGLRRMFAVMQAAASVGVLRWVFTLRPEPSLGPDARAAFAAMFGRAGQFRAARNDSRALERIPPQLRGPGGFGTLGSMPLSVITHGQPFQGPAVALEDGWSEAQRNLARLSSNSELVVAANSNHMVNLDEPQVVVEAIRRVHAAARDRAPLGAAPHAGAPLL
jgi:pimeloyl-ACP methyl ester carboxylesterase